MTDKLNEDSRKELIRYRIERADETLQEAALMRRESHYNAAINRLFYACLYSVLALLLHHGISVQTHQDVKTMLGLHFVSKGLLDVKFGRFYNDLFSRRHSGDYDDFAYNDAETVDILAPVAKAFVDAVKDLMK